jgi:hypothetical protein
VWVCAWASPKEPEIRLSIESWVRTHAALVQRAPLKTVFGSMQLKYTGRFQMALQASSPYIVVLDDDNIPGSRFVEVCLHMINTELYHGLLGVNGHVCPLPHGLADGRSATGQMPMYIDKGTTHGVWYGENHQNDRAHAVDLVGGVWFMETMWVKLLFREQAWTFQTGEDFHLTYLLRKYAGVRTFVVPIDPADPRTFGYSGHGKFGSAEMEKVKVSTLHAVTHDT